MYAQSESALKAGKRRVISRPSFSDWKVSVPVTVVALKLGRTGRPVLGSVSRLAKKGLKTVSADLLVEGQRGQRAGAGDAGAVVAH
jgi:hypothetical protein